MNIFDFLRESATYMAADEPSVWSYDRALETLSKWYVEITELPGAQMAESGGYEFHKIDHDGFFEYKLLKVMATAGIDTETGDTYMGHWLEDSALTRNVFKIPSITDESAFEEEVV